MGNKVPIAAHKDKTVVIVGGSYAGWGIAQMLWDNFKVIIIDANEYFQMTPGVIRTPVSEDFIDFVLQPFAKAEKAYAGKFTFKQGFLTEVQKNAVLI